MQCVVQINKKKASQQAHVLPTERKEKEVRLSIVKRTLIKIDCESVLCVYRSAVLTRYEKDSEC